MQPGGILNFATNQVKALFNTKGIDIFHRFLCSLISRSGISEQASSHLNSKDDYPWTVQWSQFVRDGGATERF
jgi:hypothetical protein